MEQTTIEIQSEGRTLRPFKEAEFSLIPGFKTSPTVLKFLPGFLAAQKKFGKAYRAGFNKHDTYNFSDLEAVLDAITDQLHENDIMFLQSPTFDPIACAVEVVTTLAHVSGEYVSQSILMPVIGRTSKEKPGAPAVVTAVAIATAVAYARKIVLKAAAGISDTDDDGFTAGGGDQQPEEDESEIRATAPLTGYAAGVTTGVAAMVSKPANPTLIDPAVAQLQQKYYALRADITGRLGIQPAKANGIMTQFLTGYFRTDSNGLKVRKVEDLNRVLEGLEEGIRSKAYTLDALTKDAKHLGTLAGDQSFVSNA